MNPPFPFSFVPGFRRRTVAVVVERVGVSPHPCISVPEVPAPRKFYCRLGDGLMCPLNIHRTAQEIYFTDSGITPHLRRSNH